MEVPLTLPDVTGNGKYKMAVSNLERRILACTQDSNEIPTTIHMFSGSLYMELFATLRYKTGRNRKWTNQDGGL
jgi:hypothetical protein